MDNPYEAPLVAQLVEEKSRKPSSRRGLKRVVLLFLIAVNVFGVTATGASIYGLGDDINWIPFAIICGAFSSLYWVSILGIWIAASLLSRLLNSHHSA